MLYLIIVMSAIFAMASLALDYGRVQLAKTELQTATDAAARWAVQWIPAGKNVAITKLNQAAADNKVNGVSPTFVAENVDVGSWNETTRVFTPNASPQNAVRVKAVVTVPLALGPMIGMNSCRVGASAVAKCVPMGVIGMNLFDVKNNGFIGSYNSDVTTTPTIATASNKAVVLSNGQINAGNNSKMNGDFYTGPAGVVDTEWTIAGATKKLATSVVAPSAPSWSPAANPGGLTNGNYTHGGGTLNAGTYWFTGLTVNGNLTFNGPATVIVNGNISIGGNSVTAQGGIPSNLKIYQVGANRTFTAANNGSVKAVVLAPTSDLNAQNGFKFYGMCVFETIDVHNNAEFYFDESNGSAQQLALVQ